MRQLAALLRQVAATELADGRRISHALDSMVYAGPAADRFRDAMVWAQSRRAGVESRLEALADRLTRAADEVETRQLDAKHRLDRQKAHAG